MQEEKKKRMESEKLRATKRNTYSDILHRNGVPGKIWLHQREIQPKNRQRNNNKNTQAISRKDKERNREEHEALVRNRKRTHQYKKNTLARNILCTKRNDTIQTDKHTKKQLD